MLAAVPCGSAIERRGRAIVAFILLTGARDQAAASARLKHVDLSEREFFQDAREVRTKFAKTFPTWFFPVGEDFVSIVAKWITELQEVHGFGPDEPLFPSTVVSFGPDGTNSSAAARKSMLVKRRPNSQSVPRCLPRSRASRFQATQLSPHAGAAWRARLHNAGRI